MVTLTTADEPSRPAPIIAPCAAIDGHRLVYIPYVQYSDLPSYAGLQVTTQAHTFRFRATFSWARV